MHERPRQPLEKDSPAPAGLLLSLLLSLVPVVVIAVWSLCLFGIAQHVQLN